MTDALLVITTTENQADGERLAKLLVERELAACVQMMPQITSVYRWQGNVEQSVETLLFIKTTQTIYQQLEDAIKQNHSYQTPEIIALPIESGSTDYLNWLMSSVKFQV
ncbi:MAG: divalent-cation tolerance protein CutA [Blastocatellales bacterium]